MTEQAVDREVGLHDDTGCAERRPRGAGQRRRATQRVAGLRQEVEHGDALAVAVGHVVERDRRAQRHARADAHRLRQLEAVVVGGEAVVECANKQRRVALTGVAARRARDRRADLRNVRERRPHTTTGRELRGELTDLDAALNEEGDLHLGDQQLREQHNGGHIRGVDAQDEIVHARVRVHEVGSDRRDEDRHADRVSDERSIRGASAEENALDELAAAQRDTVRNGEELRALRGETREVTGDAVDDDVRQGLINDFLHCGGAKRRHLEIL